MTSHSPWRCNPRHGPCNYIFVINFIKSNFSYVNRSCWHFKGKAFLTRSIAAPRSTISPFPCSCSSSASWRPTECLAKNTGCPPVPSNPVVDFILISSFIIPTLDDIISQDYTIRNICMYFAQDIYYIRSCCKFCQPTRRAGSILKGVNMDVFAGCASEVHGSYQHIWAWTLFTASFLVKINGRDNPVTVFTFTF